MEIDEIESRIKSILVEDLKIQSADVAAIQDDTPLFGEEGGLGLDSLDAVELVVLLQKKFGVQVETMEEGQKAFVSMRTLVNYINERMESEK